MTDLDLQTVLVERTKSVLEEMSLKRLDEEQLWQSFNVYANEVPVKDDYNDIYEQNYIIVLLGDEDEQDGGGWRVEIQHIIGYADEDDARQGHVVTATLMNNIMMDLKKHPDMMYSLRDDSHKRFADQHNEGFYEAALITFWDLQPIHEEIARELI